MIRLKDLLSENNYAPLYIGMKLEYADKALKENELKAYSTQRWWPDGKRRTDDQPDYHDSLWMKGISFTRDKRYAENWGSVVFELDQSKVRQNFHIIPYNWGFQMKDQPAKNRKREREEFLVMNISDKSFKNTRSGNISFMKFAETPGNRTLNIDRYVTAVYLNRSTYDIYTKDGTQSNSMIDTVMNHSKYKGMYGDPLKRANK